MTRKTFPSLAWLLAGCGVLAAVALLVTSASPRQRNSATEVWTANAQTVNLRQLVFEAGGKTLISIGHDIDRWDATTGELKSSSPRRTGSWLRYSPGGKFYAYQINKGIHHTVHLRRADDSLVQTFTFPDDTKTRAIFIDEIVFSHQGTLLNINYQLRHTRPRGRGFIFNEIYTVWDTRTHKQVVSRSHVVDEFSQRDYYQDPFFLPDDRQLLLLRTEADKDRYIVTSPLKANLKDLLNNKAVATYSIAPDTSSLLSDKWKFACVSPDGSSIIAVNGNRGSGPVMAGTKSNGTLYAFDPHAQRVLWKHYANNLNTQALTFSPDGKLLAWGGRDYNQYSAPSYTGKGKLLLLNAQTGEIATEITEQVWTDDIKQRQISRFETAKRLLGISPQSRRGPRYLPGDSGAIECLAFSPDGKTLAVGYSEGLIKLWRVPQG